MSCHCQQK